MNLMHVARFELRVKKKEICLFTILKLSISSWIPAFAGMTDKDGTD